DTPVRGAGSILRRRGFDGSFVAAAVRPLFVAAFSTALLVLAAVPAALVAAVPPGEGSGNAPAASAYAEELKSHVRAHIEMAHKILKSLAADLPGKAGEFARDNNEGIKCWFVSVANFLRQELNGELDRTPTLILKMQDWADKIHTLDDAIRPVFLSPSNDPLEAHGDQLRRMILQGERNEGVYARNNAGALTRNDQDIILHVVRVPGEVDVGEAGVNGPHRRPRNLPPPSPPPPPQG
ncbi:MAG: hypothetical protein BJ554DRAFT_1750, partial [Olpidium bornovanus]